MVKDRAILKQALDSSSKCGYFGDLEVDFCPELREISLKSPNHQKRRICSSAKKSKNIDQDISG
jgi:hypothetical protein